MVCSSMPGLWKILTYIIHAAYGQKGTELAGLETDDVPGVDAEDITYFEECYFIELQLPQAFAGFCWG